MTDLELDRILTLEWPTVLRRIMADVNADDFTKGFARSISRHGKKPDWHPTEKQERIMRSLMADYRSSQPEPEPDLLER